ncbi:MAG: hypothetical protein ACXWU1_01350 [Allosphingosinicella sp.]
MRATATPLLAASALLAGCASITYGPTTGWSRADDLSVYSAMTMYAGLARQQSALCNNSSPAGVATRWQEDFGAREQWVAAGLVARHGAEAVGEAEEEAVPTRRVPCPDVNVPRWRESYTRLLRMLEMRLGLA